jgi:hypothetical protein
MKKHLGVTELLAGVVALAALATAMFAGSASAGPPATAPVGVEIKSDYLTGFRPNGTPVDFTLKFTALGETTSSLAGEGRHTGSGGVKAKWSITGGFISGDVVTLSGVITEINNPALLGSLGTVSANASTGAITFDLGPLAGGPFAGQTILGEGFGNVKIRQ